MYFINLFCALWIDGYQSSRPTDFQTGRALIGRQRHQRLLSNPQSFISRNFVVSVLCYLVDHVSKIEGTTIETSHAEIRVIRCNADDLRSKVAEIEHAL